MRKLILFLSLLQNLVLLNAEQENTKWSIDTGFTSGLLAGTSKELVYVSAGSKTLLSELDWAMEPLLYWGLSLSVQRTGTRGPRFYADCSLKAGLAGDTGTITDTDWANYDGVKTHFSAHDCYTEQALLCDIRLGWEFQIADFCSISPYTSANFMHYRWTARDGYLQYANYISGVGYEEWSSSIAKTPVYGTGMGYDQEWLFFSLGLELEYAPTELLRLVAACSFFPVILCVDQDDHYLTSTQYNETMKGGYGLEPRLEIAYELSSSMRLVLIGSYRYMTGLRGNVSISAIGTSSSSSTETDTAGVGFGCFDFGATINVRL